MQDQYSNPDNGADCGSGGSLDAGLVMLICPPAFFVVCNACNWPSNNEHNSNDEHKSVKSMTSIAMQALNSQPPDL